MTTWENPPERVRRGRKVNHTELAAELRARPGEWAVFSDDVAGTAVTHINKGRLHAFRPAGHFEATGRPVEDGSKRQKVWIRYVGE